MDVQTVSSFQAVQYAPPVTKETTPPVTQSQAESSTEQENATQGRAEALAELKYSCDFSVEVGPDEATGKNVVRTYTADGTRQISQFPPPGVVAMPQDLHSMWETPRLVNMVA